MKSFREHLAGSMLIGVGLVLILAGTASAQGTNAADQAGLTLESLLKALDPVAADFKDATTTAQKDDVRKRVREKAAEIIKQDRMTISAVVKDMQAKKKTVAELTFGDPDTGSYSSLTNRSLTVQVSGPLTVAITRENAFRVTPGKTIQFSGRPVFRVPTSSNTTPHFTALFSIRIKGDTLQLGTLGLADLLWKIDVHDK